MGILFIFAKNLFSISYIRSCKVLESNELIGPGKNKIYAHIGIDLQNILVESDWYDRAKVIRNSLSSSLGKYEFHYVIIPMCVSNLEKSVHSFQKNKNDICIVTQVEKLRCLHITWSYQLIQKTYLVRTC